MEHQPQAAMIATATRGTAVVANWPQLWVTPLTRPRSDLGNQFCIARVAAGHAAASPMPKTKRITSIETKPTASVVVMVINDQNSTTMVSTLRAPYVSENHPPGIWPSA